VRIYGGFQAAWLVRLLLILDAMISRLATAVLAALLLLICSATPTHSQALDPASAEALATTLRMLADPAARGRIIASDPSAAEIDRQVQGMAGSSALVQEVYGLAAEVFADLTRNSNGDPRAMSAALDRAKSDPAGFAAMLRPETLERLRALSIKISDAQR
jgi:hypothetical protein